MLIGRRTSAGVAQRWLEEARRRWSDSAVPPEQGGPARRAGLRAMIRGWMGGFDSIGAYSGRNHTDSDDMISWREALVPISIFCNPVLW